MHKIRYIFFLLVSFLFFSCESVYLDMSNVHCKLDKATYKKDEIITISYDGSFKDSSETGSLTIDISAYKMIDEEKGEVQILNFPDSDIPSYCYDKDYYFKIKENDEMTSFIGSIQFSISEVGKYDLVVCFYGQTPKHYYGGDQTFTFPITITE